MLDLTLMGFGCETNLRLSQPLTLGNFIFTHPVVSTLAHIQFGPTIHYCPRLALVSFLETLPTCKLMGQMHPLKDG